MPGTRSLLLFVLAAIVAQGAPPESCSVTRPPSQVFVPPPPFEAAPTEGAEYLFGSDDFWLSLPKDGIWETQHEQSRYVRTKIPWFSKSFWWRSTEKDGLTVDAKRLDGDAETVHKVGAASGFIPESQQSFMINSIEFPTTGCWEIRASYQNHELKFTVWVTP